MYNLSIKIKHKNKVKRILKTFFGKDLSEEKFDKLVITNIGIINKKLEGEETYEGYWKSSIKKNARDCKRDVILKVKPGNLIIDVFRLLPYINFDKLVFVGFCGGLNTKYQIGDIITIRDILFEREKYTINPLGFGTTIQVDGMVQNDEFYQKLIDEGIDVVEMESAWLMMYALYNSKVPVEVYYVVSDLPLTKPFYEISFDSPEQKLISVGIANLASVI